MFRSYNLRCTISYYVGAGADKHSKLTATNLPNTERCLEKPPVEQTKIYVELLWAQVVEAVSRVMGPPQARF